MELGNYWWMLIWPFLIGGIVTAFRYKKEEFVLGEVEIRWKWLPAVLLSAPYVVWAAWRTDSFGDTSVYRSTFNNMPVGLSEMASYLATRPKGKGFVVLEYLFKTCISGSSVAFFFLIAILQIIFIVRIYRKYSRNYWLSFFLFVASTDYYLWMHNGIRQFLAATLIFTCIPLLVRRRYLLVCLVIVAAAMIHSTALIYLPLLIVINGKAWNWRSILLVLAIILAISYVDNISGILVELMRDTAYEGDIDILLNDTGTNLLRVLFYGIPTAMSIYFRPYISRANDPIINICVNLSVISTSIYIFSFFSSGILFGAVPIYFSLGNYILIPWIIDEIFDSSSKRLVTILFIVMYSIFFYYQCGPTWGLA